jgi:L-ascorbate 6-phosphate lactonase
MEDPTAAPERAAAVLAADIAAARAPADGFALWFLGQNGFVLKAPDGLTVAVDPYLSDWCADRGSGRFVSGRSRLYPPPLAPGGLAVDLLLLTHSHCDHADPAVLAALAGDARVRLVAPWHAAELARAARWPEDRISLIHAGQELAFSAPAAAAPGLAVRGVFALPTDGGDPNHLGYLLRFPSGASFYLTGDTAWTDTLPLLVTETLAPGLAPGAAGPDLMAVCINSGYGNLSHWDAARLAGAVKPGLAVPVHWDLLPHNSLDPFPFANSLAKNAPGVLYAPLERGRRYLWSKGKLQPAPGLARAER